MNVTNNYPHLGSEYLQHYLPRIGTAMGLGFLGYKFIIKPTYNKVTRCYQGVKKGLETFNYTIGIGKRVVNVLKSAKNDNPSELSENLQALLGSGDNNANTGELSNEEKLRAFRVQTNTEEYQSPLLDHSGYRIYGNINDKIRKEITISIELLSIKGIYQIIKHYLENEKSNDKLPSLADCMTKTLSELKKANFEGDITNSIDKFCKVLHNSINELTNVSWLKKQVSLNLILPGIKKAIEDMHEQKVNMFMKKFQSAEDEIASDKNGPNTKILDDITCNVFRAIGTACTNEKKRSTLEDSKTRNQFLSDALYGTEKEQKEFYNKLTVDFLNKYPIKKFTFGKDLQKVQKKLKASETPILREIYYTASLVIEIFKRCIVIPIQNILNWLINSIIKSFAIKSGLTQSVVESSIALLSGDNKGKGQEVLEEFFISILDDANQALSSLTNDEQAPTILSEEDKRAVMSFRKELFLAIEKYNDGNLIQNIDDTSLGRFGLNKLSEKIVPLLFDLFNNITTKENIQKYLIEGLKNLNKALKTEDEANEIDEATRKKRRENKQKRQALIERSIETLGPKLNTLLISQINDKQTKSVESSECFKEIKSRVDTLIHEIDRQNQNHQTMSLTQQTENLKTMIDLLDKIRDQIKKDGKLLIQNGIENVDLLSNLHSSIRDTKEMIIKEQELCASQEIQTKRIEESNKTQKEVLVNIIRGDGQDFAKKLALMENISINHKAIQRVKTLLERIIVQKKIIEEKNTSIAIKNFITELAESYEELNEHGVKILQEFKSKIDQNFFKNLRNATTDQKHELKHKITQVIRLALAGKKEDFEQTIKEYCDKYDKKLVDEINNSKEAEKEISKMKKEMEDLYSEQLETFLDLEPTNTETFKDNMNTQAEQIKQHTQSLEDEIKQQTNKGNDDTQHTVIKNLTCAALENNGDQVITTLLKSVINQQVLPFVKSPLLTKRILKVYAPKLI